MGKLLKNERLIFYSIFLAISICWTLLFTAKPGTQGINLIFLLVSSHYIYLLLNNIYICFMFRKSKRIKNIYDKLVCRIGSKKVFYQYILNILIDMFTYYFIIFIPLYIKYGFDFTYKSFYIITTVLIFLLYFIQEIIAMLNFLVKDGSKYMFIPVVANLLFYIYLIQYIINIYI